ncbi:TIGR03792 family protein [Nostoc sphaeroides]|uniref:TIGR03792 family protein n=1 Tax=Nostoc sphaeroides TaxID=446679 RepID=UPI001CEDE061|nr:TIGR03792 family protein [Nostoc sphaeroides]
MQKDAQIWTIALAEYPRFLAKQVWISLNDHTEIIFIICWATLEQWKAIPQADLQTIKDKFIPALRESYPVVKSAKYQVRKFPHF